MARTAHILGYPRVGADRELKKASESYWAGNLTLAELEAVGKQLRERHWKEQADAGLDYVNAGDFAFYDQVLNLTATLGVIPPRFGKVETVDLDTYFRMARGRAPSGKAASACAMRKWFDTNYHYIVPEFQPDQDFKISTQRLINEVQEAKALGHKVKVAVVGPLSFLWLGKSYKGDEFEYFDRLTLLPKLLPVYIDYLNKLTQAGADLIQIDEPILVVDLEQKWKDSFKEVYAQIAEKVEQPKLLATYFGGLDDNLDLALSLPVQGLHIDLVRAFEQLDATVAKLPQDKFLSAGIIDGRNIWKADISGLKNKLANANEKLGDRLWISASSSLLHTPHDLDRETKLNPEIKNWLAFAKQKLAEISLLSRLLDGEISQADAQAVAQFDAAKKTRDESKDIHRDEVKQRFAAIDDSLLERDTPYNVRVKSQIAWLNLPLFPTTTIGSFPQTPEIRGLRKDFKSGDLSLEDYEAGLKKEIQYCVDIQEELDIDIPVHGEAERNDMVEYFGELLQGFAFTSNGWVQSFGSRCVKPPIIYGDVARPEPMTVRWSAYAQSLTKRPMKGMLTGPVTILQWSFVRDDQPRETTCKQIALALRDEVADLEAAGVKVIQIDEPALREGLPLRKANWQTYLDWAVDSFKISASVAKDDTQIHTHMCYSEFNDIIESIAALDADVITIETARANMELLHAFEDFNYPNEIGPGVYDIHSPNIPTVEQMVHLMEKAARKIPVERLWVNPDCGLKTRKWEEVKPALVNLVEAAKILREKFKK